ncbi:WD40 repeat domain-containing protein [Thermoproteota archaeon]
MSKFLISFLLIAMMITVVHAQHPTLIWDDTVGTNDIALSKDGNYVAIASGNEVRYYGKESGTPLWTKQLGSGPFGVISVAISADGDCVVAGTRSFGGDNGYVAFWKDAKSRTSSSETPTWRSEDLGGGIFRRSLDISDDGNYVVACGTGQWVFYWANAKGRTTMSESTSWKSKEFTYVSVVDLSSDGNYVAAGVLDISNYGVAYWKNAKSLNGDPQGWNWLSTEPDTGFSDVAISDDGESVAAATGVDFSVHYWTGAKSLSGDPASTWWAGEGIAFTSIDMSNDGDSVIAAGRPDFDPKSTQGEPTKTAFVNGPTGGTVYFWGGARTLTGKPQVPTWTYDADGVIHDVAIDDSGNYMAADANQFSPGKVYFFDFRGVLLWSSPIDLADKVSISSDGSTLAVGTSTLLTGYLFDTGYTSSRPPVGGVLMPENKLVIIAPYLALAIVFAAVSTIFIMKKRKD